MTVTARAACVQIQSMEVEAAGLTGQCEALTAELEEIQSDMRSAAHSVEGAHDRIAALEASLAAAEQAADAATTTKCAPPRGRLLGNLPEAPQACYPPSSGTNCKLGACPVSMQPSL